MKRSVLVLGALAACGDNHALPPIDAPACDDARCIAPCTAVLTGNLVDTSSSVDECPLVMPGTGDATGDTMLDFLVASPMLGTQLGVRIDLGPTPTASTYTSETTTLWSAIAVRPVAMRGSCIFTAGSASTPAGSFTLELTAIDLAASLSHGSLALQMFVLPATSEQGVQSECGPGTTEELGISF